MLIIVLSIAFGSALLWFIKGLFSDSASKKEFQQPVHVELKKGENGYEDGFIHFTHPTDAWKYVDLDTEEYGTPLGI